MKALPMIDFLIHLDENHEIKSTVQIIDYLKLVSQQFKPEMIEELFEDFEWKVNNNNCYKIQGVLFDFSEKSSYEVSFVKNKTVSKIWFLSPKTLNDFISDCNRAEIELTWKEGVWEC